MGLPPFPEPETTCNTSRLSTYSPLQMSLREQPAASDLKVPLTPLGLASPSLYLGSVFC